MDKKICTPFGGRGKALVELLIKELGIPADCRGFDLHVAVDELITVTVHQYVHEAEPGDVIDVTALTSNTRVFTLVEQEHGK